MTAATAMDMTASPAAAARRAHVHERIPGIVPVRAEVRNLGEALTEWGAAWDDLAANASEPNAFAERWFVPASVRHIPLTEPVRVVGIWSAGKRQPRLLGLFPLHLASRYGRTHVNHVQNWLHSQSFLGAPLVRAGREEAFWTALLGALDEAGWAKGFLHVSGLVEAGPIHRGLKSAAQRRGRPCDTVHTRSRAMLESTLSPQDYLDRTIRKKKRKELNRLSNRLSELGKVTCSRLSSETELDRYCDEFLSLEASGWKGEAGSALGSSTAMADFFRNAVRGAWDAGKLDFLRLALDAQPLAMLVNFMTPPGSFSFKIAFDEAFARFSPGVLIQLENLKVLERKDIAWMDSCASENHPMINSLWAERRTVVRVTVPLSGWRRRAVFAVARGLEKGSALLRRLKTSIGAKS